MIIIMGTSNNATKKRYMKFQKNYLDPHFIAIITSLLTEITCAINALVSVYVIVTDEIFL